MAIILNWPFILCTVIGNALSRNSKPGQVVARVNILASDGWVLLFSTYSDKLNYIVKLVYLWLYRTYVVSVTIIKGKSVLGVHSFSIYKMT